MCVLGTVSLHLILQGPNSDWSRSYLRHERIESLLFLTGTGGTLGLFAYLVVQDAAAFPFHGPEEVVEKQ